jgi:hypothetical protein
MLYIILARGAFIFGVGVFQSAFERTKRAQGGFRQSRNGSLRELIALIRRPCFSHGAATITMVWLEYLR